MDIIQQISKELNLSSKGVTKALELLAEGATIPFIARYRKEATGNLEDVELIAIKDRHSYWTEFAKRKQTVLNTINEQGLLTDQLKSKIENCFDLNELEDIYLPYKPKKQTKGQKAIKAGLKPLAILIQQEQFDFKIEQELPRFVRGEIKTEKEAIAGAINILAEWISEDDKLRERIREQFHRYAYLSAKLKKGKDEEGAKYKDYFNYSERLDRVKAHRALAILRAEKEGILNVSIDVDKERAIENIERVVGRKYAENSYANLAFEEAYKRLLQPQFESESKKEIKDLADEESIKVFAENLKQLLLQSPLGGKRILAIDPGYRTGCKVAILNNNGDYLENRTIFPHPPQKQTQEAVAILRNLIQSHKIEAIAIGNGTAGLETEKLCRRTFNNAGIQIFSINEAGASVYSASEIAREEFPKLDVTVRGAISIGRRLIDPLAELVKIDPKSIGVGQYQHDVNQTLLKQKLDEVVELCVNHVGVELNTASFPILSHVSGLGPVLAKNIITFREENGSFRQRKDLLKVPKMGQKTFEQAAGFLRIENGTNPLDNTIIHPESYQLVKEIALLHGTSIDAILNKEVNLEESKINSLTGQYDQFTLDFVVNELNKPTRDPREPLKEARYNDISGIEDLIPGMELNGTVNNITNFGAFVDVGIKESGLVHISELADEFISNVQDIVALNQQVKVKVLSVDLDRKRVQLSMKGLN
ncbi:RNA-binding transcriptional accessory protein [Paracrocinitomix mangrovi]|uniref:Tex family protein n=1 Tax=Paracrocinitomix mangrovi TaxID=2862509 RepID=UPI001C8D6EA1|nr:Tex family protein [Paracrocinitomix mangrovi]UKN02537.1 RNA-binding transcriptional accessory protein [Paracrocinitomix mangrovi]